MRVFTKSWKYFSISCCYYSMRRLEFFKFNKALVIPGDMHGSTFIYVAAIWKDFSTNFAISKDEFQHFRLYSTWTAKAACKYYTVNFLWMLHTTYVILSIFLEQFENALLLKGFFCHGIFQNNHNIGISFLKILGIFLIPFFGLFFQLPLEGFQA